MLLLLLPTLLFAGNVLALLVPQPAIKTDGYRYLLNVPDASMMMDGPMPLLLFLHGAGDIGDDLDRLRNAEHVANLIDKFDSGDRSMSNTLAALEFVSVSPLHPAGDFIWDSSKIEDILDLVRSQHAIDSDRIYVAGHSMGAFGTWRQLMASPSLYAAAVPFAGALEGWQMYQTWPDVSRITKIPIWSFHGTADPVINVLLAQETQSYMEEHGSTVAHLTLFDGMDHNIATSGLQWRNGAVLIWLLKQFKASRA